MSIAVKGASVWSSFEKVGIDCLITGDEISPVTKLLPGDDVFGPLGFRFVLWLVRSVGRRTQWPGAFSSGAFSSGAKAEGALWACWAAVFALLWFGCFFDDSVVVGNLISGSSAFSKSSLNISKFMVHALLKPGLENLERYFVSVWDECSCAVYLNILCLNILWHCLSLGLEWKLTFSSPVATAEFSKSAGILSAALSQHHLLGFDIAQLEFHHLH